MNTAANFIRIGKVHKGLPDFVFPKPAPRRPGIDPKPRRTLVAAALMLAALSLVAGPAAGQPGDRLAASRPPSHQTGTLAGTVRLSGPPPPPGVLRVHKEQAFCGSMVPDQSLVAASDGALKNVVVTLRGPGLDRQTGRPRNIQLDNIGCRFAPHVQAAPVGSNLLLLNSDVILHDAHARIGPRTLFNDGIPRWRRVTRTLRQPGLVRIICELHHAWMSAYVVVTPNRFFAVTGSRGRYAIDGIPPGTYDMRFWHERLGEVSRRVVVSPGTTRRHDVTLPMR